MEAILKAYPKDVRLVYKQFPLPSHPHAKMAAAAALAAQAQGKFWPMHDKLFAQYNSLSPEAIATMASALGLDMTRFRQDMQSAQIKQTIEQDVADGDKLIVDSTPTFFINGKKYNGTLEMMVLKPDFGSGIGREITQGWTSSRLRRFPAKRGADGSISRLPGGSGPREIGCLVRRRSPRESFSSSSTWLWP